MPQDADHQKLELELFQYLNAPETDKVRLLRAIQRCRSPRPERRQRIAQAKTETDMRAKAIAGIKLLAEALTALASRADALWGNSADEAHIAAANRQLQFCANVLPAFAMLLAEGRHAE